MATNTLQVIIRLCLLAMSTFTVGAWELGAQELLHRQELRRSPDEAATKAKEWLRVATYFHHQELVFRMRAQTLIDRYCRDAAIYPMATKTVSRADALARQYSEYESKAEENARMAASYEGKLTGLGYKLEKVSAVVVSVKDLELEGTGN